MAATWALVASPWGARVPPSMPVIRPCCTAHGLPCIGGDLRLVRMAAQIGAGAVGLAGIAIEKGGKLLAGEVGLEIKAVGNPLFNRPLTAGLVPDGAGGVHPFQPGEAEVAVNPGRKAHWTGSRLRCPRRAHG